MVRKTGYQLSLILSVLLILSGCSGAGDTALVGSGPPPPADTTAPSTPTNLTASATSSSQINLSWTASTDAVGVTGYRIYRAGTQIGTSATNSYSNTGLTASTAYSFAVSAYDAAGNNSAQSSSVSATTQAATDTTAPSTPTGLTATTISSSQINLSWAASTDAVGVTGYRIYRAGTQIGTSATNSYSNTGLTASTAYSYTVSAYDAAGNNSVQSGSVSATTGATASPPSTLGTVLLEDFSNGIPKNGANPPDDLFSPYLGADSSQTYGVTNGQFWNKGGPTDFYWHFFPYPYVWPTGFAQNYVKSGVFSPNTNRLRFKFMCNKDMPKRTDGGGSFDVGTYVKQKGDSQSNFQGNHFYHTFNPNLYANRWAIAELNSHPQHRVGTTGDPGVDPEWNNPTTGAPVHYFDGLTRWYFGNPNNTAMLNSTCYFDDFYFDTESDEPEDKVSTLVYTYSGSRYEVSWQSLPNVTISYNVRYSTASMKANGFLSGTDGGTVKNPGNDYLGTFWTSPAISESSTGMFVAIQPVGNSNFSEVYIPNFSGTQSGGGAQSMSFQNFYGPSVPVN